MLQLSYAPLWATLNDTGMKKIDLIGIVSNSVLRKIENEDPVSLKVIGQLCEGLGVPVERVIEFRDV
jgi:DNA-binding Xre family transcriptional regulator